MSFLEGLCTKGLITRRNVIPLLLYWKTKLYRLKINTYPKTSPSHSRMKTALLCNASSQNSILFFASASKIQNSGVWGWRGKVWSQLFYFYYICSISISFLFWFLCLVSVSLNVFFSMLSTAVTLVLTPNHPLLVFLISSPPLSHLELPYWSTG